MRTLRLLLLVGLASGFISDKLFVSSQPSLTTADDLYLEGRTSGDLPIDDEDGDDDGSGSGSGSGDYALFDLTEKEELLRRFRNFTTVPKENVTVQPQPQPTPGSTHNPSTTAAESQDRSTTVKDNEETPFITPDVKIVDVEVPGIGSTADDELVQETTVTTTVMTPSETTAAAESGKDVPEVTESDEDNSLDRWGVSTTKDGEKKVVIPEIDNEIVSIDGRGSRMYNVEAPEEVTSENMWERTDVLAAVIACGVVGFLCAVFLLLLLAYRMKKKDEGSYDLGDTKISTTTYHKAPTKEFYA